MASVRRKPLVVGQVYHILNKSIAGFKIFNDDFEFFRMMAAIRHYQKEKPPFKLARFIRSAEAKKKQSTATVILSDKEKLVEIIAYCLMPTHLHLILKQLKENGISTFMNNILNSYTRYFNTKHKRKGPLWEGRFKSILVETDEQLLHLTRYIHLNPSTAYLVDKPRDWPVSSYREYVSKADDSDRICKYDGLLEIEPVSYEKFVSGRVSYQKELAGIKKLLLE